MTSSYGSRSSRRDTKSKRTEPPGATVLLRLVAPIALGCVFTFVFPALAVAGGRWSDSSPEGFSCSGKGLPRKAVRVWNATVLIRGQAVLGDTSGDLRLHSTAGSGLVLEMDQRRGTALVVTNFHVIHCVDRLCTLRIGLAADDAPGQELWTNEVHVKASDPDRDLAFLQVRLPKGVTVDVPRLASVSCLANGDGKVLTIGWPDLTLRQQWGVDPPANADEHVKRYSHGMFLVDIASYQPHTASGRVLHRMDVIFHNADVLPGNSGGPLLTADGLVVGINSQVVGTAPSPGHRYCARRSALDHDGCAHLAIPAEEIAEDMERLFSLRMDLATCSATPDLTRLPVRASLDRPATDTLAP